MYDVNCQKHRKSDIRQPALSLSKGQTSYIIIMITPIEIRKQSFRKSLRGYDTEEVHAFLQTLSDEWEQQQHEMRS